MGLFDFVSSMGKKLFNKDDDAAGNIKSAIDEDNPGITNLDVAFDSGTVSLSGEAKTAEAGKNCTDCRQRERSERCRCLWYQRTKPCYRCAVLHD